MIICLVMRTTLGALLDTRLYNCHFMADTSASKSLFVSQKLFLEKKFFQRRFKFSQHLLSAQFYWKIIRTLYVLLGTGHLCYVQLTLTRAMIYRNIPWIVLRWIVHPVDSPPVIVPPWIFPPWIFPPWIVPRG